MRKILATGVLFGLSITAANFMWNSKKDFSEYIAKKSNTVTGKQQKWININ